MLLCYGSLEKLKERSEQRQGCCSLTGKSEESEPWRQDQGVTWVRPLLPAGSLAASLPGTLRVQEEVKSSCIGRGMDMLQSKPALSPCPKGFFFISSAGDSLRGGFQQNTHQLSRCIFNVLMPQGVHKRGLGIFDQLCLLLYRVYLAFNVIFKMCSLDFICHCLYLAQMTLLESLLYFPDQDVFILCLGMRDRNHLLSSVRRQRK